MNYHIFQTKLLVTMLRGLLLLILFDVGHGFRISFVLSRSRSQHFQKNIIGHLSANRRRSIELNACYLTLALEEPRDGLEWKYLDDFDEFESSCTEQHEVLPLYPLPTVYLPAGNATLNNIEPQNIEMAIDLEKGMYGGRFVAVLRATNTGRVCSVGTIMRQVDFEAHYDVYDNSTITRIQTHCICEGIVDIVDVLNPDAIGLEQKLRGTITYLKARVRPRTCTANTNDEPIIEESPVVEEDLIVSRLVAEYQAVRRLLLDGRADDDLPPFAAPQLPQYLPELSAASFLEQSFWGTAHAWQTYCATVREGYHIRLVADRNELMVAAALRKGGSLKLPVHIEDLDLEDRQRVSQLEIWAQEAWKSTGLDPCIDFQVLLTLLDERQRLDHFLKMLTRELFRLEMSKDASSDESMAEESAAPKGAWFDSTAWE